MAAVKANAYGHGAADVARTLAAAGMARFSVAHVLEGVALREAGITRPILVMGAALPEALPAFARFGLDLAVTSPESAQTLRSARPRTAMRSRSTSKRTPACTGSGSTRTPPSRPSGCSPPRRASTVAGLWTHFANVAGDFTDTQVARFDALVQQVADAGVPVPPLLHLANTGGLLATPASVRGRQIVRAGGALYGLVSDRMLAGVADLRPVMRLVGRIVQVKTVAAGETVSYGRTWTAPAHDAHRRPSARATATGCRARSRTAAASASAARGSPSPGACAWTC